MKRLTFKQIRQMFWESHPEFKSEYKKTYKQNQYRTDIRCAFVDFTDNLHRDGIITDWQANNCTL